MLHHPAPTGRCEDVGLHGCIFMDRACTCVAGILLELFADKQMDAFQAARRDHRMDAIVIDRSLWLCSRHPNYFGQMMRWWGVWMFSAQLSWELAWPCAITFLFNFISVKLLEDRQLENKGDAFRAYQRCVPSILLPIPPMLSRLLVSPLWISTGPSAPRSLAAFAISQCAGTLNRPPSHFIATSDAHY